jgi:hypothetical protein
MTNKPTEFKVFLEVLRIQVKTILAATGSFTPLLALAILTKYEYAIFLFSAFLFAYLPLLMVGIYVWTRGGVRARISGNLGSSRGEKS